MKLQELSLPGTIHFYAKVGRRNLESGLRKGAPLMHYCGGSTFAPFLDIVVVRNVGIEIPPEKPVWPMQTCMCMGRDTYAYEWLCQIGI